MDAGDANDEDDKDIVEEARGNCIDDHTVDACAAGVGVGTPCAAGDGENELELHSGLAGMPTSEDLPALALDDGASEIDLDDGRTGSPMYE